MLSDNCIFRSGSFECVNLLVCVYFSNSGSCHYDSCGALSFSDCEINFPKCTLFNGSCVNNACDTSSCNKGY
jgi:hypothetical protein